MKATAAALSALALIAVPPAASSHGTEGHHAGAKAAKPAAVEQQPFGRAGDPAKVRRTIAIGMSDAMRYEPAEIRVKQGETVKIVASNKGQVLHEIVIGTMDALKEHAALMRKFPEMEHDEPNMAHVKPGAREDLVWQFNKPGEFYFACLIPGHFEAGMVGKIVVATH